MGGSGVNEARGSETTVYSLWPKSVTALSMSEMDGRAYRDNVGTEVVLEYALERAARFSGRGQRPARCC